MLRQVVARGGREQGLNGAHRLWVGAVAGGRRTHGCNGVSSGGAGEGGGGRKVGSKVCCLSTGTHQEGPSLSLRVVASPTLILRVVDLSPLHPRLVVQSSSSAAATVAVGLSER